MDLLHGLPDLGLALPPLHARFAAAGSAVGEEEGAASGSAPPLLRSPKGEGGRASDGKGRRAGGPPRLHAGEGGAPVVLLDSMPEREARGWSSLPLRRRGSHPRHCQRTEGEGLGRESVGERGWRDVVVLSLSRGAQPGSPSTRGTPLASIAGWGDRSEERKTLTLAFIYW